MDPVRGSCGGHGVRETAEVRDFGRTGGGRRLREGPGKIVDRVSPGQPQSFECHHQPMEEYSSGRGGMTQEGETRGGTFHG